MSHPLRIPTVVLLLQILFAGDFVQGQAPQVQFLYPPHATIDGSVEVELIGKQADRVERLYLARPGLEARLLEKGKASFSVAADAPTGERDVWALSVGGVAGPFRFATSRLPTRTEKEPNNTPAAAQELELPVAVCGRIDPGTDGDWFRVTLKAGDGLTLACRSASLGGTLWPTLLVVDPHGREIAHDSLTQQEPTLHIIAAEAGAYSIGVQDRSYNSTPSRFYQLSLTTGPWIVGAYPPAIQKGQTQTLTLYGYSLAASEPCAADSPLRRRTVEVTAPDSAPRAERGWCLSRSLFVDAWEYRHPEMEGSVRLELVNGPLADAAAETSKGGREAATLRELPFEVVNRFDSPREVVHWYRFTAQKERTYWLEAIAERIDRTCDLELIIHDTAGKPLTTIGNITTPKELASEVALESRDPAGAWKAPADGEYLIAVRDLLATAAPAYERAYRLSVGPRREDVRVVAQLAKGKEENGWAVRAGGSLTLSLVAVRQGGQEGPIEVRAEELPPGLNIPAVTIPAKKGTAVLEITAEKDAEPWMGAIRLIATTESNRTPVTVEVIPLSRADPAASAVSRVLDELVIAVLPASEKAEK